MKEEDQLEFREELAICNLRRVVMAPHRLCEKPSTKETNDESSSSLRAEI